MPTLYIDVDSLRPDHLGCYGYGKRTSPNVDEFAADAVRFDRAYVANSPCMPSRAAFLSGQYGIANGVETNGPPGESMHGLHHGETRTIAEALFHDRVHTAAVSSFPRHPAPWFHYLWHEFYSPQEPEGGYFQTPRGETVADLAIDVIEERADGEFFLYAQFWDPHAPYNRTDEQVAAFDDGDLPPYPTRAQIDDQQDWDAFRSAKQLDIEDRADLGTLLANYDAEINYVDHHVGRLLDALKDAGIYEETTVVLTADHGEEFGEHGLYREHWSTHEGTQRVPLLVKPPAGTDYEAGSREHLVTNVDMAPTLADYAGLSPADSWQGRTLRPVLDDPGAEWRDHVVVDHGLYTAQRAVRTDRWKFIRTYDPGMWGGVVPERQLYDVAADPWEQDDVSEAHPDVVDELETRMLRWAETHVGEQEDALHQVAREGPPGSRSRAGEWEGV